MRRAPRRRSLCLAFFAGTTRANPPTTRVRAFSDAGLLDSLSDRHTHTHTSHVFSSIWAAAAAHDDGPRAPRRTRQRPPSVLFFSCPRSAPPPPPEFFCIFFCCSLGCKRCLPYTQWNPTSAPLPSVPPPRRRPFLPPLQLRRLGMSSMTKSSDAPGGMMPPAPRSPYASAAGMTTRRLPPSFMAGRSSAPRIA